ncbi:LAMI_0G04104g1_1 [Lachancea mirantina]|uniref:LAMI_0G04104g1_1 n=1 Tax=Lachancea mirantina TaxID=1230905 RepID=A0A1G4K8C5_9SACH|nr:LAMI_0G04104g1_1 [Lachancea mirantina]
MRNLSQTVIALGFLLRLFGLGLADSSVFNLTAIRAGSLLQYASVFASSSKLYLGVCDSPLQATITSQGQLRFADDSYAIVCDNGTIVQGNRDQGSFEFTISSGFVNYKGSSGFTAVALQGESANPQGKWIFATKGTSLQDLSILIRATVLNGGVAPDFDSIATPTSLTLTQPSSLSSMTTSTAKNPWNYMPSTFLTPVSSTSYTITSLTPPPQTVVAPVSFVTFEVSQQPHTRGSSRDNSDASQLPISASISTSLHSIRSMSITSWCQSSQQNPIYSRAPNETIPTFPSLVHPMETSILTNTSKFDTHLLSGARSTNSTSTSLLNSCLPVVVTRSNASLTEAFSTADTHARSMRNFTVPIHLLVTSSEMMLSTQQPTLQAGTPTSVTFPPPMNLSVNTSRADSLPTTASTSSIATRVSSSQFFSSNSVSQFRGSNIGIRIGLNNYISGLVLIAMLL